MSKPKRIAQLGKRHRRDNGPEALEVQEVEPLSSHQIGQLHVHTDTVLAGGARALISAEHEAQRLSAKFGEEIEAKWCLATPWLLSLDQNDPRQRARARYAMQWRPRFLAVVALTRSVMLGRRAARVAKGTIVEHVRLDPDFKAQLDEAKEQAIELLTDMTMRTAIEGEMKPIYWQGIRVGFEPQFDNRLRIEMLRAYKPDRFKTPGSKVTVNTGPNVFGGNNLIFDSPVMGKLVEMRQASLEKIREKMANAVEVGTDRPKPVPPTS